MLPGANNPKYATDPICEDKKRIKELEAALAALAALKEQHQDLKGTHEKVCRMALCHFPAGSNGRHMMETEIKRHTGNTKWFRGKYNELKEELRTERQLHCECQRTCLELIGVEEQLEKELAEAKRLAAKALEGIDDHWQTLPENQQTMADLKALARRKEANNV
jgi:hypothetical protein